jgi:two-component system response regulator
MTDLTKARRILLIEDDETDAEMTLDALREAGVAHEIIVRTDRDGAVALLRADADPRPALVLLDLNLGNDSGLDVLREMRAVPALRDTPVIVLTGSDMPADRRLAHRLGAVAFLRKPLLASSLATALREVRAQYDSAL